MYKGKGDSTMRKWTALLCLILALCLLGGCAANQEKAKVPISWYLRTDDVDLYNSLKGIQVIEDATGVDVTFQSPPNNSEDAYKMMVISGNLPDVIMWNHDVSMDRMYAEGLIIDLTDLIAQYAPNLTRIYTERPELRKQVETADGKMYYFPCINPMQTVEEICRKCYNGLIIRDDWLKKLGLTAPMTIDEWYDVLTAFKEGDPNGNSEQDEIPFDAGSGGLLLFMPAFGITNGWYVNPETGKVGYGQYSEEYKAYLETMAKWYAEGLVQNVYADENGTLADSADPNLYADLAGSWKGLANYWEQRLPQVKEKNPNADFVAVQWPACVDGSGVSYADNYGMSYGDRVSTVISTDCKNVEAAARLIDAMYSEEGTNCTTWGTEDSDPINAKQDWTNGHGTYTIDPETGKKVETEWANTICENFYDGCLLYTSDAADE